METKFIVVAGGVISGVGKGVTTASLGKVMSEHGYRTTLIKIDPYLNYDAGTLRPTEHGEVWVTDDGGEIDQDLGTYERFLDQSIPKKNSITNGQIYHTVIERERRGGYLGQTVQFIPHITQEIAKRVRDAGEGYDIAIIEIGGIVGDYENIPFLFALKALERQLGAGSLAYVLVVYLPIPLHINEMKTKPAQQAIKALNEQGIFPDIILCRAQVELDAERKEKIETYAHIPAGSVLSAPNVRTIYQIPLDLEREHVGQKLLARLGLTSRKKPDWSVWQQQVTTLLQADRVINVAIVGKYLAIGDFQMSDSYTSVYHALLHAATALGVRVNVVWLNAQDFENKDACFAQLDQVDAVIVPGGFGAGGVEGKIRAIEYVRTHHLPFLGLCYGMQLAAVEYARHVANFAGAHTTEVDPGALHPVVAILPTQQELLAQNNVGGTMRVGAYTATLSRGSLVERLYKQAPSRIVSVDQQGRSVVSERHRHRYEINSAYVEPLQEKGLIFSGYHVREDGTSLMEYLELADHPYFVATQSHPEFTSRFSQPNPLFYGLMQAALLRADKRGSK